MDRGRCKVRMNQIIVADAFGQKKGDCCRIALQPCTPDTPER
jgi:hypothetical protein